MLQKAKFWKVHAGESFNERQRTVLNRLLDGFEGKMTSSKRATLTKSSQDTASRDIDDLLARKILTKDAAGGRSSRIVVQSLKSLSGSITPTLAPDGLRCAITFRALVARTGREP